MPDFNTLEPVNNLSFQVAWESTLKCNMDCSYCGDGHDNSVEHPSLEDSLKTVDFIFDYLQVQMNKRPKHLKIAGLNIQGGESLFHPNIVQILSYINEKKSNIDYTLTVAMITNAIAGHRTWKKIIDLVDYFTISYHAEMTDKQELLFRANCLYTKRNNKEFQVSVMMHPSNWNKCISVIDYCKNQNIKYLPRQIDHSWTEFRFNYSKEQQEFLLGKTPPTVKEKVKALLSNGINLSSKGRACCGGNTLCTDNSCQTQYVMGNNFKNWYCSVDKFFLYIRQSTGEVFTNKDCKTNLESKIAPLGYLSDTATILQNAKTYKDPIICQKKSCWCGLCAPKAATLDQYNTIIKKYLLD